MATITIEHLSEEAFRRLRRQAEQESLDPSIIAAHYLEVGLAAWHPEDRRSPAELLELARAIRRNDKSAAFTPEFIRAAREYGRA